MSDLSLRPGLRRILFGTAALLTAALVACTQDFTTPGSCPQTCPGGSVRILDTVIDATFAGDSSFVGYISAGEGTGLLVSTAEPTDQYLTAMRFGGLPDSVRIGDSLYAFTIDSVAISLGVLARDPGVTGLTLQLYRAPATLDSGVTYTDVAAFLTPGNFLDTLAIPDTLTNGNLQVMFSGADLAKVEIPPADSGVLSLAVGLTADSATGVELGSTLAGSLLPKITWYISVAAVDSTKQPPAVTRVPSFETYVEQNPPVPDPDQLQIGGAPSARFIVRFDVPAEVLIGVQILRAELVLQPVAPIAGVPGIATSITARGVLSDQGAKSPLVPLLASAVAVSAQQTDSVTIEVIDLVRAWQTLVNPPAQAFFLSLQPEGSSFTRPIFASTRSVAGKPRLRITYVPPVDFQEP